MLALLCVMAQSIPNVPIPPRAFVNSSRNGQHCSFVNISLKNMPILINIDIFIKNIFNTYASQRYMQFSLHHHPTTQYFLHPSKESSFRQRDQFAHGGETIDETFKGKDTFFGSEWLRQRGLEKLCVMFESFVVCMLNATTLTERFHCDEKIIMFISLLVICLSFTIYFKYVRK